MNISISAETIGRIGNLPITNSMLSSWIASILLIMLGFVATRKIGLIPKGFQNSFEAVIEYLYNTTESVIENEKATKKYFPLLATIFLFILTNNWLGLLPGVGTIGLHEEHHGKSVLVPFFRSGNADLNTTLALAIIAVISVQVFGIIAIGIAPHIKKYINLSSPVNFVVGILELFSEVSRIISFSFRLFGNIFAGEVLLTVIAYIVPYFAPLPFYVLELFVGAIQALVFTMLTIVFIKTATVMHE